MPDPAVGVLVAGERRRQRTVCGSALAVRGGLQQRGTHERVAKLERAVGDAKQALPLGGVERILGQAGLARSPHHGGDLLPVIQRRDQQSRLRVGGQPLDPLREGLHATRRSRGVVSGRAE